MKSCLIVDDTRTIRSIVKKMVTGFGFQPVEAENGLQALQACDKQIPDVILLDWNMPVMNGLEFQEQFCQFMNKGNNWDDACVQDVQPLRDACRDAKGLDFIVLESRRGNVSVAVWTPPVEYRACRPTYYLYDCKQLAGR